MAAFRGERFDIDLGSDEDDRPPSPAVPPTISLFPGFIKDIQEKPTGATSKSPVAPTGASSTSGFPIHKKRVAISKFKQARDERANANPNASNDNAATIDARLGLSKKEREDIDQENRQRLAQMSEETISQERQELMQGLPPSLIQRLLQRATIDGPPTEYSYSPNSDSGSPRVVESGASNKPEMRADNANDTLQTETNKNVSFDVPEIPSAASSSPSSPPAQQSQTQQSSQPLPPMHFPKPPQPPSLDPNSPTFLTDLHTKYFPNLAADPAALAWMSEPSATELAAYSTSCDSLPISALRFSFAGAILSPSVAANIPTTAGLHHHGAAPAAAGYTIPELAHLARSTFPSQRCIAFQTLGRILYRLGKGEFGRGEEGKDVERGLWGCIREGRVLETLQREAGRGSGHVSAIAYAVDALWLWREGGGKEPKEFGAA